MMTPFEWVVGDSSKDHTVTALPPTAAQPPRYTTLRGTTECRPTYLWLRDGAVKSRVSRSGGTWHWPGPPWLCAPGAVAGSRQVPAACISRVTRIRFTRTQSVLRGGLVEVGDRFWVSPWPGRPWAMRVSARSGPRQQPLAAGAAGGRALHVHVGRARLPRPDRSRLTS